MAKKMQEKVPEKKQNKENTLKKIFITPVKNEIGQFIIGLLFVLTAFYMLLAFVSFFLTGAADQSILENPQSGDLGVNNQIQNYAGARGAQLANYLINGCFGISAFFIVIFIAVTGLKMMRAYQIKLTKWFICCSLLLIWFSIGLGFLFEGTFGDSFIYPGGIHGHNVSDFLVSQIGSPGVCLFLLITAILFCIYLSKETIECIRRILHPEFIQRKNKNGNTIEEDLLSSNSTDNPTIKETTVTIETENNTETESRTVDFDLDNRPAKTDSGSSHTQLQADSDLSMPENKPLTFDNSEWVKPAASEESTIAPAPAQKQEPELEISSVISDEDEAYTGPDMEPYNPRLDLENYRCPTLDLMKKYENNEPAIDMEEQNANKDRIINVLRSFGVEIASIKASVGPTITLYEITPAQGVRIAKIRNLENDIALSLSALGIRIIAPIPGKGTIGIEVPNKNPRIVSMESILSSKKYQENNMELPIAMGKTISNEVFMVDLAKMPHMLVAGATGMGKSVGLNAIVTSLLYKKHPAELKFVIIDPKKVEFSIYAPIENHFLAKLPDGEDAIITDVTKVVQTLNSLCVEMDTRYDLLKKARVRNIKEYNAKFISRRLNPNNGHKFLPYIVVIVDEFGDLIMTAGKEVELPIARIAQLARAVGIHMIIATQRPTTNIITGTIKANFPARVAFRVSSMIDSRTILDRPGANQLIGKGDMLFLQGQDPVRVQCAFVDTPEVENIVHYICTQQGYPTAFQLPEYVAGDGEGSSAGDVDMNKLDPMFEDAARLIIIHQQGSTSLIQRKFSIGYNRAGRIMDQLEKAGVVGPAQGSKARDVLCQTEMDLEMILSNLS